MASVRTAGRWSLTSFDLPLHKLDWWKFYCLILDLKSQANSRILRLTVSRLKSSRFPFFKYYVDCESQLLPSQALRER